jgi:enterochelin esterase-like enzyme
MRSRLVLVPLLVLGLVPNIRAQDDYQPGPDSLVQAGVPKGELIKGTYTAKEGSVFPGTERDYTIYLPPSTGSGPSGKPAPFMVFQDGVIYNAPVVFDNLIAKGQIPPLIGIFIKPGIVPAANPNALPRYNRSYEYDSVSDTYSRFLIDEFLPAIEAKHGLKLSSDPNDAAISGNSSGGICAFMAAWHRPDRFRRVFSGVGTYVGIHGADQLPVLVRKYEPKPLRIYLQSGEHDNDLYCGDWWMANQTMERALKWAGYDVNHTWGTGGHNAKHATAIFPDVLRWLWRDYATAKEIKPNPRGESKWLGYSVLGEGRWEDMPLPEKDPYSGNWASEKPPYLEDRMALAADKNGDVWASQAAFYRVLKQGANGAFEVVYDKLMHLLPGVSCGVANRVYFLEESQMGPMMSRTYVNGSTLDREHDVKPGLFTTIENTKATGICFSNAGICYVAGGFNSIPMIKYISPEGRELGQTLLNNDQAWSWIRLALSPDQTQLYASNFSRSSIWSFQILADGKLAHGQEFLKLQEPIDDRCRAHGLCVDTNGWLYVATALGIQVCDQAGRVNFIIPAPSSGQPHDVCFGGKDLGELFIACGDKIYKRPTKAHGIVSGQMAPIKPPPPKL